MLDFNTKPDWDFDIIEEPAYDSQGDAIPNTLHIRREDTGASLGLHGGQYKVITHSDVINSMTEHADLAKISRDYTITTTTLDGGRKIRGEILFNDLVNEPQVGDYTKFRISFFNSYDASWAYGVDANGLRLWCLNGCTTPDPMARFIMKHTKQVDTEAVAGRMASAADMFLNRNEEWQAFTKIEVEAHNFELFIKKTICKGFTRQHDKQVVNNKQVENLMKHWSENARALGKNKWAAYNALTAWATHTEGSNPEVTRRNRETAIAKAMAGYSWQTL